MIRLSAARSRPVRLGSSEQHSLMAAKPAFRSDQAEPLPVVMRVSLPQAERKQEWLRVQQELSLQEARHSGLPVELQESGRVTLAELAAWSKLVPRSCWPSSCRNDQHRPGRPRHLRSLTLVQRRVCRPSDHTVLLPAKPKWRRQRGSMWSTMAAKSATTRSILEA